MTAWRLSFRIGRDHLRAAELVFTPTGQTLAINDGYQALEFWSVANGERIHSLPMAPRGSFAMSPDGKLLAVSAAKHVIQLWELATCQMIAQWPAHESDISGLVFFRRTAGC